MNSKSGDGFRNSDNSAASGEAHKRVDGLQTRPVEQAAQRPCALTASPSGHSLQTPLRMPCPSGHTQFPAAFRDEPNPHSQPRSNPDA